MTFRESCKESKPHPILAWSVNTKTIEWSVHIANGVWCRVSVIVRQAYIKKSIPRRSAKRASPAFHGLTKLVQFASLRPSCVREVNFNVITATESIPELPPSSDDNWKASDMKYPVVLLTRLLQMCSCLNTSRWKERHDCTFKPLLANIWPSNSWTTTISQPERQNNEPAKGSVTVSRSGQPTRQSVSRSVGRNNKPTNQPTS